MPASAASPIPPARLPRPGGATHYDAATRAAAVLLATASLVACASPPRPASQPAPHTPVTTSPAPAPFFLGLRSAIYGVADLAKARAWYASVLGAQPYFDEPFYVGFNVGGFELGLLPDSTAAGRRAAAGIAYWGVADAPAAYAKLISLGANDHTPIQDVGGGIRIGAVHDPFGNVLGVVENPHFRVEPVPE